MADQSVQRRLAAILAADVAGYTQLMEKDADGTVAAWQAARADVIRPTTLDHSGKLVKLTGDGFLIEFPTVLDAVNCAIAVQKELVSSTLDFRIGVHMGDIIDDGEDIHGEGVNVAARLEGLADAGGICISGSVHEQVRNRIDVTYDDLGEKKVKNVSAPVRVYAIRLDGAATPAHASADSEAALSDKPSIAVLPFDNLSGDPEQEYFSDGMTEDIITALSRIRQFFVIARNTTFTYKGQAVDVQAVADDLGVRYVLEGSVRKVGNRVRITVQLIDGDTGNHLWAEKYDRDLDDIFALQDEITLTVVGSIEPELSKAEINRASAKRPENLGAWELFHRGMAHFYRRSREDIVEAQKCFGRAIDLDPNFAPAYSGLANAHYYNIIFGYTEAADEERAASMEKAQKAVDLDPDDPAAHTILGLVSYVRHSDRAISALQKSLELNPSSALAHSSLAMALADVGRFDESWKHHDEAEHLGQRDPTLPMIIARRSASLYWAGRHEDALKCINQAISHPNAQLWQNYAMIAVSSVQLGRLEEARNAVGRIHEINPGITLGTVRDFAFSGTDNLDRFVDDLRTAGVPEV